MKKTLYLSLAVIILANADVQNVYGSMEVDRSELPALLTQETTSPIEAEMQQFRDVSISPLRTIGGRMFSALRIPEAETADLMNQYFGRNLEKVYAALPPELRENFKGLLEKAVNATPDAWNEFQKHAFDKSLRVDAYIETPTPRHSVKATEADVALMSLLLFHRDCCPEEWKIGGMESRELDVLAQAMVLRGQVSSTVFQYSPEGIVSLNCYGIDNGNVGSIAPILGKNSIVKTLTLGGFRVSKDAYEAIAKALKDNKSLERVNLLTAYFGIQTLAPTLARLPNFRALEITFEYDDGIGSLVAPMIEALGEFSDLEELVLSFNHNITVRSAENLISTLARFHSLNKLDLSHNRLSGKFITELARILPGLSNLEKLNLSFNSIGDAEVATIANVLSQLQLLYLNLEHNHIQNTGTTAIANVLSQLQLWYLNLGYNYIGNSGAIAIGNALPGSQVSDLDLSGNTYIKSQGAKALASGAGGSKCLVTLNLDSCTIGDEGAKYFGELLRTGDNSLTSLGLADNCITDRGVNDLALGLEVDRKLTELGLEDNPKIHDEGVKAILEIMNSDTNPTGNDVLTNVKLGESTKYYMRESVRERIDRDRRLRKF